MLSLGCLAQPVCGPHGSARKDKPGNRHKLCVAKTGELTQVNFIAPRSEICAGNCSGCNAYQGMFKRGGTLEKISCLRQYQRQRQCVGLG